MLALLGKLNWMISMFFFTTMWNYMFLVDYDEMELLSDFPKANYYWEKYKPYFQKQRDKFNKNNLIKE